MHRTRTYTPLLAAVAASLLLSACTGASASGDSAGGDKAGGDSAPVTLRIGTDDTPGRPGAEQVEQFAKEVDQRSEGRITIEPVWQAAGASVDDWDQAVAHMVIDGEVDVGMIPARAWDTEGVTTLRALHAPFLVTTEDVVAHIVTSDLADEMLAGLDAVGVTGLALLPEGFRHLFVFGDPPASLPNLGGKVVRAPTSDTTYATLTALGGRPDDLGADNAAYQRGIGDGSIIAAESSFALAATIQAPTTAVGDVTLFPKVNSLVVNTDVFDALSPDQQRVLEDAAQATIGWAIEQTPSDVDLAAQYCANGGRIVSADADRDELRQAVQPVFDELEQDEATATMIDQIEAIASDAAPATIPPCHGSRGDTDTSSEVAAGQDGFPDGVYRMEMPVEVLLDAGVDEVDAYNHAGMWTLTFEDGRFQESSCIGTYTVEDARVVIRLGDDADCGTAAGKVLFSAGWTTDGDQLQFSDVRSGHGSDLLVEALFGTRPFTRIG
jgi:TRAP-type C4-dicarboxylate transport system substrate-binding protein